jgi:anti-sigma B factor antagonist
MSVQITVREVGDVTILDVKGRVTLEGGSSDLRQAIRGLLERGRIKLILNLGEVSWIDSTGIGELVAAFTRTSNQKGQLKLLNLTERVRKLLQDTRLYTVFKVFDDETKAIASFATVPAAK